MTWMDQIFAKATQISCVEGNPLPPPKNVIDQIMKNLSV